MNNSIPSTEGTMMSELAAAQVAALQQPVKKEDTASSTVTPNTPLPETTDSQDWSAELKALSAKLAQADTEKRQSSEPQKTEYPWGPNNPEPNMVDNRAVISNGDVYDIVSADEPRPQQLAESKVASNLNDTETPAPQAQPSNIYTNLHSDYAKGSPRILVRHEDKDPIHDQMPGWGMSPSLRPSTSTTKWEPAPAEATPAEDIVPPTEELSDATEYDTEIDETDATVVDTDQTVETPEQRAAAEAAARLTGNPETPAQLTEAATEKGFWATIQRAWKKTTSVKSLVTSLAASAASSLGIGAVATGLTATVGAPVTLAVVGGAMAVFGAYALKKGIDLARKTKAETGMSWKQFFTDRRVLLGLIAGTGLAALKFVPGVAPLGLLATTATEWGLNIFGEVKHNQAKRELVAAQQRVLAARGYTEQLLSEEGYLREGQGQKLLDLPKIISGATDTNKTAQERRLPREFAIALLQAINSGDANATFTFNGQALKISEFKFANVDKINDTDMSNLISTIWTKWQNTSDTDKANLLHQAVDAYVQDENELVEAAVAKERAIELDTLKTVMSFRAAGMITNAIAMTTSGLTMAHRGLQANALTQEAKTLTNAEVQNERTLVKDQDAVVTKHVDAQGHAVYGIDLDGNDHNGVDMYVDNSGEIHPMTEAGAIRAAAVEANVNDFSKVSITHAAGGSSLGAETILIDGETNKVIAVVRSGPDGFQILNTETLKDVIKLDGQGVTNVGAISVSNGVPVTEVTTATGQHYVVNIAEMQVVGQAQVDTAGMGAATGVVTQTSSWDGSGVVGKYSEGWGHNVSWHGKDINVNMPWGGAYAGALEQLKPYTELPVGNPNHMSMLEAEDFAGRVANGAHSAYVGIDTLGEKYSIAGTTGFKDLTDYIAKHPLSQTSSTYIPLVMTGATATPLVTADFSSFTPNLSDSLQKVAQLSTGVDERAAYLGALAGGVGFLESVRDRNSQLRPDMEARYEVGQDDKVLASTTPAQFASYAGSGNTFIDRTGQRVRTAVGQVGGRVGAAASTTRDRISGAADATRERVQRVVNRAPAATTEVENAAKELEAAELRRAALETRHGDSQDPAVLVSKINADAEIEVARIRAEAAQKAATLVSSMPQPQVGQPQQPPQPQPPTPQQVPPAQPAPVQPQPQSQAGTTVVAPQTVQGTAEVPSEETREAALNEAQKSIFGVAARTDEPLQSDQQFIQPADTWTEQPGEVNKFLLSHRTLQRFVEGAQHMLKIAPALRLFDSNPFRDTASGIIQQGTRVNTELSIHGKDQGGHPRVGNTGFSVPLPASEQRFMARDTEKTMIEVRERMQDDLKLLIANKLQEEFATEEERVNLNNYLERGTFKVSSALDLFLDGQSKSKVNEEMVDSFIVLMSTLNDPKNLTEQNQLNDKGQTEFKRTVAEMVSRIENWRSMVGKASVRLNSAWRGIPAEVTVALVHAALDLSGFEPAEGTRDARTKYTNIDQIARSTGYVKAGSGWEYTLRALDKFKNESQASSITTPPSPTRGTPGSGPAAGAGPSGTTQTGNQPAPQAPTEESPQPQQETTSQTQMTREQAVTEYEQAVSAVRDLRDHNISQIDPTYSLTIKRLNKARENLARLSPAPSSEPQAPQEVALPESQTTTADSKINFAPTQESDVNARTSVFVTQDRAMAAGVSSIEAESDYHEAQDSISVVASQSRVRAVLVDGSTNPQNQGRRAAIREFADYMTNNATRYATNVAVDQAIVIAQNNFVNTEQAKQLQPFEKPYGAVVGVDISRYPDGNTARVEYAYRGDTSLFVWNIQEFPHKRDWDISSGPSHFQELTQRHSMKQRLRDIGKTDTRSLADDLFGGDLYRTLDSDKPMTLSDLTTGSLDVDMNSLVILMSDGGKPDKLLLDKLEKSEHRNLLDGLCLRYLSGGVTLEEVNQRYAEFCRTEGERDDITISVIDPFADIRMK